MPMDEWEIHPDDLSPAQREVADLIGFENYLKLIDVYAAETIYIPKGCVNLMIQLSNFY